MVPFAQVRPSDASTIFRYAQQGTTVHVDIVPTCFLVKEKPQSNTAKLFVTVAGSMNFQAADNDVLRIIHFATRVGYFKEIDASNLKHVYGIHYDYDDKTIAHPIFHSQMAPMAEFKDRINEAYHKNFDIADDCVTPLLSNIRIPTAQMDVFAVFLQLFSDHFVNESSGRDALDAYRRSIELCSIFEGSGSASCLKKAMDRRSFHSQHWYNYPSLET